MKNLAIVAMMLMQAAWVMAAEKSDSPVACKGGPRYVVAANDQRWTLTNGENKVKSHPGEGTFALLDFSVFPPATSTLVDVPCSVIGPPTCVAMTPDETLAIVVAAMKVNPNDPLTQVPDNRVTVIDLEKKKVIQTLTVGHQPSSVSISSDGKMALVSNRTDGTVTALKIEGKTVSVGATAQVCTPDDSLAHVAISPDKSFALGTLNKSAALVKIPLQDGVPGSAVSRITAKEGPYVVAFAADGKTAVVANTVSNCVLVLKIDRGEVRVEQCIDVAKIPEGLDISPDGRWVLVCCMNNSTVPLADPARQDHSEVLLLKETNGVYSEVQRLKADRIAQTAIFTPDMKYVVVAGFENQRLRVYRFESGKLEDTGVTIPMAGQPCSLRRAAD